MKTKLFIVIATALVLLTLGLFVACSSGSNSNPSNNTGTVNISISDPPTCAAPNGPYAHVWVAVKDVKIHQSASAGPNDAGWVDLTPDLSTAPQQIDLLGIANNTCFLAMLGSKVELQAGTYQQIRVFLGDASIASSLSNNNCKDGTGVNCVQMTADNSFHILNLSSESTTGIKIPSGQLAGGAFTIAPGEVKDLNIDFDTCDSIVPEGNGQFRLKPVLHAGEVALTSTSITGHLVDSVSHTSIIGGTAIVALESLDSAAGIDRVIMQVSPDTNGNFVLCPVPAGTYDVVAVAVNGAGVAYAATITTGAQPGNALGDIPMVAQLGANLTDGSITGTVSTTTGTAGTAADITLFAMQQVSINSTNVNVIIPLAQQSSATASVTTASGGSCAANTDCATYTLAVPAMWPNIGAFSSGGTSYAQSNAVPVTYSVGADASLSGAPDCTPPEVIVNTLNGGGALGVTPGGSSGAATLSLTACQ